MFFKKLFNKRKKERSETLLEIINNQLNDNDPQGIVEVFEEFKSRGYGEMEIKKMFSDVFEGEIYKLNNGTRKEFDRDYYLSALKAIK